MLLMGRKNERVKKRSGSCWKHGSCNYGQNYFHVNYSTWKWWTLHRWSGSLDPLCSWGKHPLKAKEKILYITDIFCTEKDSVSSSGNNNHSRSSSKCVSIPLLPGTEQISRAFRKVVHLFTRLLWPPRSFCWTDHMEQGNSFTWKLQKYGDKYCFIFHSCFSPSIAIYHYISKQLSVLYLHVALWKMKRSIGYIMLMEDLHCLISYSTAELRIYGSLPSGWMRCGVPLLTGYEAWELPLQLML